MLKKVMCTFIFSLLFFFNTNPVLATSSQGNRMANMGAQLACGESRIYAQWSYTRIYNDVTSHYINARDKYIVNAPNDDGSYASCDVSVATIVRASGVDPNFEAFLVPNQLRYLSSNEDWERMGTYYKGNSTGALRPGDVMIVDPDNNNSGNDYMHIWMYLGNEAVRKYYPNSNADSVEGGFNSYENGSYYPTLFNAKENAHGDPRPYAIYRFKGTDFVEGVQKWAEQVSTQKFEYQAADACDIVSQELATYINRFFFYICVGGIILLVVLSSLNLIKVIVGHDNDGLYEFLQNLKVRIICLVVLLVLPVIIPYLLNTINNIAPIVGYNSDNPLCNSSSN